MGKFNIDRFKIGRFRLIALMSLTSLYTSVNYASSRHELYSQVIEHPQRSVQDKIKDKTRKPELILPFTQITQNNKVLELGAGGGHTTELLARLVGNKGKVYAQGVSATRVKNGRLPNVIALRKHLLYELEEVLAENAVKKGSLDAAVIFFALHDFYLNSRIDQQAVLNTIYQFLKPDGSLIILDNAADADAGLSVNRSLHRIGENFVISELKKAGFTVDSTSQALQNLKDDHTQRWQVFNGEHDRFAIRFVKK
ncbi:methyltransferase domain-containing protein [Aliikangiella sp. IMCC44359]|uniref:methyltransferase domain-containing protein n=1 Tax=Aliikangiella sp. IMCC44359 TaxID=3459125 RepID=UPI00403B2776